MVTNSPLFYKIRLATGRVLGPVDLVRIRDLILAGHITGEEEIRTDPVGEWKSASSYPEISNLLLQHLEGKLRADTVVGVAAPDAETVALAGSSKELPEDRTIVAESITLESSPSKSTDVPQESLTSEDVSDTKIIRKKDETSNEKTQAIFHNIPPQVNKDKKTPLLSNRVRLILIAGVAVFLALDFFPTQKSVVAPSRIRPVLPDLSGKSVAPEKSQNLYKEAMSAYVLDNEVGYREAARLLLVAVRLDKSNVKALAMLASSYINLIDSSLKDEKYFAVISRLIELSRAKSVDLPETVIADVEFFLILNRDEAAQHRIVEYTRRHENFGIEMFYYLASVYYSRGNYREAANYLSHIPDEKAFSPKVFYLKGKIAEALSSVDEALSEYRKAIKKSQSHAKSRLRIAEIQNSRGKVTAASDEIKYLIANPSTLAPLQLAAAYYLHGMLYKAIGENDLAVEELEQAVSLDQSNHDYSLELYNLRAKLGQSVAQYREAAKMYFFLGQGEALLKEGKHQEALVEYLKARQTLSSALPFVKIGEMFLALNDLSNAKINFEKAAELAPNSSRVWSKYIQVLIQSYEWEEANKAMKMFAKIQNSQSYIDKLSGDLYSKQELYPQAAIYYQKAMSHTVIDSDVYLAYADILRKTGTCEKALQFYALVRRFDPLSIRATSGVAKCIAETDSIERAIVMVQEEASKSPGLKAPLFSILAELYLQKGDYLAARRTVDQAIAADESLAAPWKTKAAIFLNDQNVDKNALDKALAAYKSYSDRNPSDPSGYLERYKIFMQQRKYQLAANELAAIYAVFPKYPNLHFYKGVLYSAMGNTKSAIEEFQIELKNNENHISSMLELGKELVKVGAVDRALKHFNQAMALAPNAPDPKHQAGYANQLLKNYEGAIALYQAAIRLDPGNPVIYKRLGTAYLSRGNQTAASDAFRKYLQLAPDAPDKSTFEKYIR